MAGVKRPFERDGAGEASEGALGQMKGSVAVIVGPRQFVPRDHEDIAGKHDLYRGPGHAGQIHEDFDRGVGFENVERRRAFGGRFGGTADSTRERLEQPAQIVGQFPALDKDAGHGQSYHPLLPYTSQMADNDSNDAPVPSDGTADPAAPITSRFLFVDVAAQRAKQLRRGALLRIDRHAGGPHKLERLAMEEVRQQVVQYTLPTGYLGKGETK